LVAAGRREDVVSRIVERYRAVARRCDAVVVVGSDLDDGQPTELAFNARLAIEFGSVVVAVVNGATHDGEAHESEDQPHHSLTDPGATVVAVIVNRAPAGTVVPTLPVPTYVIPEVPTLAAPTVAEVAAALHAQVLTGDQTALGRDVLGFVVGAAQVPAVLDHLTPGALMITPGDRADLLVASAAAQVSGVVSIAGIVLTLGLSPDPTAMRVFESLHPGLAVLQVTTGSYETIAASTRIEHHLNNGNPRKVAAALGAFESNVDMAQLSDLLDVSRSTRVTPMM